MWPTEQFEFETPERKRIFRNYMLLIFAYVPTISFLDIQMLLEKPKLKCSGKVVSIEIHNWSESPKGP